MLANNAFAGIQTRSSGTGDTSVFTRIRGTTGPTLPRGVEFPAMISECPTCHRRTVHCERCGRDATDDSDGRLPRWCPNCGAMLGEPPIQPRHQSLVIVVDETLGALKYGPRRQTALIFVAVICGVIASFFTFGLLSPPKEPPSGPRINRETYSIVLPNKDWVFDLDHWQSQAADLAFVATGRGYKGELLIVQVIRPKDAPLTLDALAQQTREQWSRQWQSCTILSNENSQATVAGEKAARIVAVSDPYPSSGFDRFQYDRRRREAVLLIHEGIGYRLTAEELDVCFDRVERHFAKFISSLTFEKAD